MKKIIFAIIISYFSMSSILLSDTYPNTSIGVIDINKVLTESKAALDASKQIEVIQKKVENDAKSEDESLIDEREKLIEQQSIMAPEAFEIKVQDFDKKVQKYQIERQEKVRQLDIVVQTARSEILDVVTPLLKEYSNELGITVILEKNSIVLSADSMDMTSEIIDRLNKKLPKIKVKFDN